MKICIKYAAYKGDEDVVNTVNVTCDKNVDLNNPSIQTDLNRIAYSHCNMEGYEYLHIIDIDKEN